MAENQTLTDLLHQAEDLGLLSTPLTIKCNTCDSLFPREYANCPKCTMEKEMNIQIDFEF